MGTGAALWAAIVHGWWRAHGALEAVLRDTYTGRILALAWAQFAEFWCYVALGALVSTLVRCLLPARRIRAALGGRLHGSIVTASLAGLISPMCTFAAIPVVGALVRAGVPPAPLFAFMVASPLMNPSLFVSTAGIIGLDMAVARTIAAMGMGLLAGYAAHHVSQRGWVVFTVRAGSDGGGAAGPDLAPDGAGGQARPSLASMARAFARDGRFIGKYFLLGLLLGAAAQVFLSAETVRFVVGPQAVWAVPVAVALGVPLYSCGGAALPAVESMMRLGMSPNAALAFFVAGPATKLSTLAVLAGVFGRRVLALYLAVMLLGTLLFGYAYPFRATGSPVGVAAGWAAALGLAG